MLSKLAIVVGSGAVLGFNLPAQAQTCYPLNVVGARETKIEKKVSPPGTLVTRNNWNTDFVVPSTQPFSQFVVTVLPKNGGEYQLQVLLKYNNDSADRIYSQTTRLPEGKPFTVTGSTRKNAIPYQVNVSVGGIPATGNSYTVSACGM